MVVAALLLVMIENHVAVAAEMPKHTQQYANGSVKQKKVDKLLEMLKSIGISDPEITRLVNEINSRHYDGYFLLYEERIAGGNLSFRYSTEGGGVGVKHFELLYAPEDSHTEYSLRSNVVTVNYKLNF